MDNVNIKKIVAIHQPNFFPWLGYFRKIAQSDHFVILDNIQYPKTGGSYINRVEAIVNNEPDWITVPIVRGYHGFRNIDQMEINNRVNWRTKILRTIQTNYARSLFFKQIFPLLTKLIMNEMSNLSFFNINIINSLVEQLQMDNSKIIHSSKLNANGKATDLLISIIKSLSGTSYLHGTGAFKYQDNDKFLRAGIELVFQDSSSIVYPQFNTKEFIPGLSIIDSLMNCGFKGVRKIIYS